MRKRGRKQKPELNDKRKDRMTVTGDRMSVPEYRAYLKAQGMSPPLIKGLSQGGQQVQTTVPKPKRKHKYGAKPVYDENGKQLYASKKEAKRGAELELMQKQGLISGLVKQPKYKFVATERMPLGWYFDSGRVVQYWPDFEYYDEAGELIVEDVKGFKTPEYKLKKPMMWNYFAIEVQEV